MCGLLNTDLGVEAKRIELFKRTSIPSQGSPCFIVYFT
jgi:hypothetical protein